MRKSILYQLGITNSEVNNQKPTTEQRQQSSADVLIKTTPDIIVFTDGSTINNGRINARGGFAVVFPNNPEYTMSEPMRGANVTNNRAEYMAFIRAMELAINIDPQCKRRLVVYTDSNLLIQSITKWLPAWRQNNWRKHDGKPVLNRDLLERMIELMKSRRVLFHHVMAHTGKTDWMHMWNDKADQMARKASNEYVGSNKHYVDSSAGPYNE